MIPKITGAGGRWYHVGDGMVAVRNRRANPSPYFSVLKLDHVTLIQMAPSLEIVMEKLVQFVTGCIAYI